MAILLQVFSRKFRNFMACASIKSDVLTNFDEIKLNFRSFHTGDKSQSLPIKKVQNANAIASY